MESEGIRLQVYLARSGIGSRRGCESYIAEGRVTVNGEVVRDRARRIRPGDRVRFDGRTVEPEEKLHHLALHKPPRYLCSNYDPEGRPLAKDLLSPHFEERLYNVGRLDFMSEGLIFFTNDGTFAQKAGHPSSEVDKEYLLELAEQRSEEELSRHLERALTGIEIEGEVYTLRAYGVESPSTVRITLREGKNRELRRLFSHFGVPLRRLIRTRIGPVELGTLQRGRFRRLTEHELRWFLNR